MLNNATLIFQTFGYVISAFIAARAIVIILRVISEFIRGA